MPKAFDLGIPALQGDLARVEIELRAAVLADDPFLTEVATHLIEAGGKRIRPTMALSAAYAAAGHGVHQPAPDAVVAGAVASELVHLGSLYHDDVIDEAATRRGVPSVNARWNNIVAILAGDYLLARASEIAAALGGDVAGLLAGTIGELCKGQMLELQFLFDTTRTRESYFEAITGKTAALMASSCRIGGMTAQLPAPTIDALAEFGHLTGLAFQIVDDVLDLVATERDLGKPACNDLTEGIYTLPVIEALAEVDELGALLGARLAPDEAERARMLVTSTGSIGRALQEAEDLAAQAVACLESVDIDPGARDALSGLPRFMLERAQFATP